ncbi:MAG: zinc ABC transporter solute-binding protein [Woeseiaceae bacterium]|nr:zinc ABC transporter solute-binding protein [Woeseiaceae bacterium]
MRSMLLSITILLLPAGASALEVFACEPEWASLVSELAGDDVNVTVATTAFQDPHRLQAKPSLIAAIRKADLVVCTGADLEIGWLPLLLRRGGNPEIFMASDFVRKLEVPQVISRSQGDIHPQGNPHVHLDPRNIRRVAAALAEQLAEMDAKNAVAYNTRLADFQERWSDALATWDQRAMSLAGLEIASHHRSFSYLANWLGLDIVATIESKPGIPPSGAQLASLLERLNDNPPVVVIRTPYENEKPSLWLSERLSLPAIQLPYTISGNAAVTDLFTLFEETLRILEEYRS